MTNYDSLPTRGNHYLDELIWRPDSAEVVPDILGSASALARSRWALSHDPDMPDWDWIVGPTGFNPASGRPFNLSHRPGQPCESTNKSCYCAWHRNPIPGGWCICERHKESA